MKKIQKFIRLFFVVGLTGLAGTAVFRTLAVHANAQQTYTVTSNADTDDGNCNSSCTLHEAINAANSNAGADVIVFNLAEESTITLGGSQLPIVVDDVAIDGSTAVSLTISGNNQSRIFEIGSDTAVTFTQLTLSNANSGANNGGAVLNHGNLVLNQMRLTNNQAQRGAGIRNQADAHLTINDSYLDENVSTDNGAAISNHGTLTVTHTIFQQNTSTTDEGGGIFNVGQVTVSNSAFISNTAEYGGGIYNFGGIVSIDESHFAGHTVIDDGGALWNNHTMTITNTTLRENSADGNGGAIMNTGGTLTMTAGMLVSNTAGGSGGGIANIDTSTLTVNDTTISGNKSNPNGGGIANIDSYLTLNRTILSHNSAVDSGGGLYIAGDSTLTITGSNLSHNFAGQAGTGGGGLYIQNASGMTTITNSSFNENRVTGFGGGIYNYRSSLAIENSTFHNNRTSGGRYGLGISTTSFSETIIRNSTFNSDDATPPTIYANGVMTISNSTFVGSGTGIATWGSLHLVDTIIAFNRVDCELEGGTGAVTAEYTLMANSGDDACGLQDGVDNNLIGVDPRLAPLANYGGATQTHALQEDSPAIDAGSCSGNTITSDQRGIDRPHDGNDDDVPACDIGAFEADRFFSFVYLPTILTAP